MCIYIFLFIYLYLYIYTYNVYLCVCVDIFPNINSPSCYFRNPSTPDPATSPNSVLRPRGRGAASSAALKTRCRWRPPGRVRLESLGCQVDWDLFLGVKLGRLQNFEGVGVSNHFKTGKKDMKHD